MRTFCHLFPFYILIDNFYNFIYKMAYVEKPTVKNLTQSMKREAVSDKRKLSNATFKENALAFTNDQIRFENRTLTKDRICKGDEINTVFSGVLDSISGDELSQRLSSDFYDINFMEAVRCLIDSLIDKEHGDKTMREKIHEYIGGIRRIGAESVNGNAMVAGLKKRSCNNKGIKKKGLCNDQSKKEISNIFLMKSPRTPFKSSEMVHEAIIGLEGVNKLRDRIPFFSYVFEAFKTGPPVFDNDGKLVGWADQNSFQVNYAIYELISGAREISKTNDPEEFLSLYCHGIAALKIANDEFDFGHHDAHDENLLSRKVSPHEFYVHIPLDGKDYYILSKKGTIAAFIDYGMSHIKVKNEDGTMRDIGIIDPTGYFRSVGISPEYSNIVSDAYKLICMCMLTYNENGNKKMEHVCRKVLGYFFAVTEITEAQMDMILDHQWDDRFNIRKQLTTKKVKIDNKYKEIPIWNLVDLFKHCTNILKEFDPRNVVVGKSKKPAKVLGSDEIQISRREIANEIRSFASGEIESPDSYELSSSRGKSNERSLNEKVNKTPELSFKKEEAEVNELLNYEISSSFYTVENMTRDEIESHMSAFSENANEVIKLLDIITRIKEKISQLSDAVSVNEVFAPILENLNRKLNNLNRLYRSVKSHLILSEKHLKQIIYGFSSKKTPSENDEKKASKDTLYPLYDKYRIIKGICDELK